MKLAHYIDSDDLEEILYMTAQDISREYGVYGRGTALVPWRESCSSGD